MRATRTQHAIVLLMAGVLALAAVPVRSEEMQAIALERWKLKQGSGRTSTVGQGAIVLRQYSTVRCDDVGLEAAEVRVQAEWLNPVDYAGISVALDVIYDDRVAERITGTIPKGTRHQEILYKLGWGAARRIQSLELSHGATGGEIRLTAVKAAVRRTAVTIASSALGGARLQAGDNLSNDVLIAAWDSPREKLPYLTGVTTGEIRIVASVSSGIAWVLERGADVRVLALGADGVMLKSFPVRVDGSARSITIALKDVDLKRVAKLVFQGGGNGVSLAVRQITVGGAPEAPGLKELNDRLQALLRQWGEGKSVPPDALPQLTALLGYYRALE